MLMTRSEINEMVMNMEFDQVYAEFIMNSKTEVLITNGDMLLEKMEAGFLLDEFIDHLCELHEAVE